MRTFIAVPISEAIRLTLKEFQVQLGQSKSIIKWVAPKNIHLTLHFLGELEVFQIEQVNKLIAKITASEKPFKIDIEGTGAFPQLSRPRILWVGLTSGKNDLIRLHQALKKELSKVNLLNEHKPFSPHITLGRVRSSNGINHLRNILQENQQQQWGSQSVESIELIQSLLYPSGPVYRVLNRFPLKN